VAEVSRGNMGAVTGVVGAAGGLGGFFPPILLGIFKDYLGDYMFGFVLLSLFALVCLVYNSGKIQTIFTTKKQGGVSSLS
jgi:MFS transporter, NNP family, nitrate/nitrite transporter